MKCIILMAVLMGILPGLVLAQEYRGDRRGDRNGDYHQEHISGNVHQHHNNGPNVYKPNRVAVSAQFRGLGVRSYPKPYARTQLLNVPRERSAIAFPVRGPGDIFVHANVFARTNFSSNPVIRTHMALITGGAFRAQIGIYNANERIVGNYYWHTGNGFNYCHYYDRWGYHWYGWYLGNAYFWTRWYSNNWWWYDPAYYRWCYWHDGGWWWQDPDTTNVYVYNNGSYMPADGGVNANVNVNVGNGQGAPNAQAQVQTQGGNNTFYSNDGSREVKLVGADAFLYDVSGQNLFKPVYLGTNVTSVKFSNTSNGKPLQVMLLFGDGSFGLFDNQGNSINGGNNSPVNNNQPPANNMDSSMNNGGAGQPSVGGNDNPPSVPQSDSPGNGNAQPPAGGNGNPPPVPGSGT